MTTKVKLTGTGSDQVILGSSPATWKYTEGVTPALTTVDLPAQVEDGKGGRSRTDLAGVYTLRMESGGGKLTFANIYPLRKLPGNVPDIDRWLLGDRRFWWPYAHIGPRRYNWRRNTAFKRLKDIKGPTPQLLEDVAPVIQYAPWSMRTDEGADARPWTGREILVDVLETLVTFETSFAGESVGFSPPSIVFNDYEGGGLRETLDEVPVENLLIDDAGNAAVSRVLSYLPGVGIYIDSDGNYRIFSKAAAAPIVGGPSKVGQGIAKLVQNSRTRPSKIHVLFTRECEVRFDFWEDEALSTAPIEVNDEVEKRFMTNVLGVPDFNLKIGGKDRPMGSWVSFNDALTAWNEDGVPGFGKLDYPIIRKAMVPFLDLWSGILALGQREPNADWAGRINAINQNYRTTFQVNQKWWSRILSVQASRLALIDQATGARAPAAVFADFCRLGSQRSYFRDLGAGVDLAYAMNQKSYPQDKGSPLLDPADRFPIAKDTKFSDARVTIADPDQGVIQINFVPDATRLYEMALPSMIEIPGENAADGRPLRPGPTANLVDRETPITFDMISEQFKAGNFAKVPQLTAEYRAAVIITAIPAAWNSRDKDGQVKNYQLHRITIDPEEHGDELRKMVVSDAAASLMDAKGPEMFVRVGSGVEVAKIAWMDSRKDDIERVFSLGDGKEPDLDGLVINEGDAAAGASLNRIALAVAAQVYSEMADHVQGARGINLTDVEPDGNLQDVTFTVGTNGEGTTVLDYPEKLQKFDLMAFLDPSTRAKIMKLAR